MDKQTLGQSLYIVNRKIKSKLSSGRKNHSRLSVERLYKLKDSTLAKMVKEGNATLLGYQVAFYKYSDNKRYYLYQVNEHYYYHSPVEYGDNLSEVTYLGMVMDAYEIPFREPIRMSLKQALLNLERYKKGKVTLFG
ncbi:YkyB family protein [Alkalihalobacillus sp. NPDC078783]|uniref:YkyB family protein n=1 Tax=Streptomyces albidoflavus TaxID=1886 RepID=UPI0033C2EE92